MSKVEEDLEALVKQLQNANDKSVFDEILVLQKFIGQPISDHQPILKALTKAERDMTELNQIELNLTSLINVANAELEVIDHYGVPVEQVTNIIGQSLFTEHRRVRYKEVVFELDLHQSILWKFTGTRQ